MRLPRIRAWYRLRRGAATRDMGFTNVRYLEGGIQSWKQAGLATEPFGEADM